TPPDARIVTRSLRGPARGTGPRTGRQPQLLASNQMSQAALLIQAARPVPQTSGRAVGAIATGKAGRSSARRYWSTPAAALRPSAIAQTIRDWPRPMSPAAETPGTDVWEDASLAT